MSTDLQQLASIKLNYRLDGPKTGRSLVFINSLGTNLNMWDVVIKDLANEFLCLRYDKRGHGGSATPQGPYSIEQFSSDLSLLLESLEFEPDVIIGISVGGLIAMDYTLRYSHGLDGLVLSDTAAQIGAPETWQERIGAVESRGLEAVAPEILPRWFAEGFAANHPNSFQHYEKVLASQSSAGYAASCAALRDADLRDRVSEIDLPTLVLCGEEDLATPPQVCSNLAQSLPQVRFATIAGAGHLPPIEQPSEFAREVRDFVGGLA